MALANVALFGGSFLTPVIVGKLTASMGWEWTFNFLAIFSGVCLPLVIFCVPETAFRRAAHLNTDIEGEYGRGDGFRNPANTTTTQPLESETENKSSSSQKSREEEAKKEAAEVETKVEDRNDHGGTEGATHDTHDTHDTQDIIPPKATYWQTLKLFNGRKTDESYWKLFIRPLPLFLHPGILWVRRSPHPSLSTHCSQTEHPQACLTQGVLIGWTVFIGVVLAVIFSVPPLWFSEVQVGYLYTGAFIGSIAGLFLSGLLSDYTAKLLIKLNRGIYEPEFRIVLVLFQLIFSAMGLYGFGITTENVGRFGYVVPDVFFGFVIVGMVMGAVASALYVVDAHRMYSFILFIHQ